MPLQFPTPIFNGGKIATPILAPVGTSLLPSYSFAASINSGLYFDTTGPKIGLTLAGSNVFIVNPSFIQGIIPWNMHSGSATNPPYGFANDPDTGMYLVGDGDLGWTVANGLKLNLTAVLLKLASGVDLQLGRAAAASVGTASTHKIEVKDNTGTSYFVLATNA